MMKKGVLLIGLIWLALVGFAQVDVDPQKYGFKVWTGQQLPDFKIRMSDGKQVDTKKLRGKVLLIDFSGTQCVHCIQGMKRFDKEIFDRFKGEDLVVIPILIKYKDENDVKAFQKKYNFNFPMGLDQKREVAPRFFEGGIPRYFVVDRKGRIVYHGPGYENGAFEKMVGEIEKALKQK